MDIKELYKLKKKDADKGAKILAKSFYNYPMFRYVLGAKHNQENLQAVLRFIIKYVIIYGEAYATSPELEGIILFSDYKDYNFTFFRSLRSGGLSLFKLGAEVGRKFSEFDDFSLKLHENSIKSPHQYIILLGVDPKKQGQGIASKLMLPVLELAKEKGQPIYLETHDSDNLPIYQRYGFEVVCADRVPGSDISHWGMLKKELIK
ncbi:GNAT family N-acetyltransferase [Halonatronum saccharophilum]|uniref:GNAT family N-acetyltransferase n=1 Tax=Halonatronum saccharophilum TaxID=150060 RepID=UPI000481C84B|nr:GNAT family N-acetyltransferase [Halonatronum saccharophilum]